MPGGAGFAGRLLWFGTLAALALLAAYVFLRTLGAVSADATLPIERVAGALLSWIDALPSAQARLLAAGTALAVGLLSLTAMAWRGRSGSPLAGEWLHVLEADERGIILVANNGIESVVASAVESTPGVFEASAEARPSGRGVSLIVDIAVLEGADVRRAGLGARARAIEAVERLVGLDVHKVRVRVDVLSAEQLGRTVL
jgi:hypothetical protein